MLTLDMGGRQKMGIYTWCMDGIRLLHGGLQPSGLVKRRFNFNCNSRKRIMTMPHLASGTVLLV
jgi:hypothetical protein